MYCPAFRQSTGVGVEYAFLVWMYRHVDGLDGPDGTDGGVMGKGHRFPAATLWTVSQPMALFPPDCLGSRCQVGHWAVESRAVLPLLGLNDLLQGCLPIVIHSPPPTPLQFTGLISHLTGAWVQYLWVCNCRHPFGVLKQTSLTVISEWALFSPINTPTLILISPINTLGSRLDAEVEQTTLMQYFTFTVSS